MATASTLVAAVAAKTLSPDHSNDDILAILNRGCLEIAGGGDRVHGNVVVPPLPDLFTYDEVTQLADEEFAALPPDYHRGVVRVSYEGESLKRLDSYAELVAKYEGSNGVPQAYHIKGNKIWLAPVPTDDVDVRVYYHRIPIDMEIVLEDPPDVEAVDSEPDGIPVHLHHKLLVNYACREIFSEIEQGLEGKSPDTIKHDALYQMALTDLERFIGPEDGTPQNVDDDYYTEDNIT